MPAASVAISTTCGRHAGGRTSSGHCRRKGRLARDVSQRPLALDRRAAERRSPATRGRDANPPAVISPENPVDVLHTHYRKATIVWRRLQKHAHGRSSIRCTFRTFPWADLWRLLSDFGDQVHAAASDARDWLVNDAHVPPQRITLIPHGIHPERFPVPDAAAKHNARASLGLADDDRVALYLGRLEDPKNESWLIDLAATTQNALPRLRVLIAGDGPNENAVRKQIEHQNLNHRIQMLGHREPLPLLHAADALLLPSQREGFSYACAEAMCGPASRFSAPVPAAPRI